jgi:hypothetical protein
MGLVTLVAACAFSMGSDLFIPLDMSDQCNPAIARVANIAHDGGAGSINRWRPYIAEASQRFGVPEQWMRSVMHAESGGRLFLYGHPITSPAGAIGLMQIMPRTYCELRRRYGLGGDPYDPRNSILAGAAYIREMYDRFGASGWVAAYNAGPRRFTDHLQTGRPLSPETGRYLISVGDLANGSATPREPVPSGSSRASAPSVYGQSANSATADEPPILRAIRTQSERRPDLETAGDSALFAQPSRSPSAEKQPSATPSFGQSDAPQRAIGMPDTTVDDGVFVPLGSANSRQ